MDHDVHLPFCGRGTDAECEGGGTVYTVYDQVQAGRSIDVRFVRVMTDTETSEMFVTYTETINADKTIAACYDFSDSGKCEQQILEGLPDTGDGGAVTGVFPWGSVASLLSLLALVRYALRRR